MLLYLDGLVEPPVGAVDEGAVPAQHLAEAVLLAPTRVAGILAGNNHCIVVVPDLCVILSEIALA